MRVLRGSLGNLDQSDWLCAHVAAREHLRRHFEVDAESIVAAALSKLAREGAIKTKVAEKAFAEQGWAPKIRGMGFKRRAAFLQVAVPR